MAVRDNDNNLPVGVDDGKQALIGTDIFTSAGETAHAQLMKVSWGDSSNVYRADTGTPLPVQIYGLTGTLSTVTVTGSVKGLGTFMIGNTSGSAIHVTGGVNAFIYGVTGATPVTVTGGVSILNNVGITGTVNVTGGRALNWNLDRVEVTGSLGKFWNLSNLTDGIQVYGPSGVTHVPTRIFGSNGTQIGASGNALNVNVVGAGISANISISPTINVQNATGGILLVQGTANGTPLPVTFNSTPTVQVTNPSGELLSIDSFASAIQYNTANQSYDALNNLEKLLTCGQYTDNQINTFVTVPQFLRGLSNILGVFGGNNSVYQRLVNVESGTSAIKAKTSLNYVSNPNVYVFGLTASTSSFNIPSLTSGSLGISQTTTNGFLYQNKSSQIIYLTSSNYLSTLFGSCIAGGPCPDGVSVAGTDYVINPLLYDSSKIANGSYAISNGQSAILPVLFDRAFIASGTTAALNITPV